MTHCFRNFFRKLRNSSSPNPQFLSFCAVSSLLECLKNVSCKPFSLDGYFFVWSAMVVYTHGPSLHFDLRSGIKGIASFIRQDWSAWCRCTLQYHKNYSVIMYMLWITLVTSLKCYIDTQELFCIKLYHNKRKKEKNIKCLLQMISVFMAFATGRLPPLSFGLQICHLATPALVRAWWRLPFSWSEVLCQTQSVKKFM